MVEHYSEIDRISSGCSEIKQALNEQLHRTTNEHYKTDIEKDLVMVNNLQHIAIAVKNDLDSDMVGASTELLLRIAANDFRKKLVMLPDKKTTCREIVRSLESIHKSILHMRLRAGSGDQLVMK